MHFKHVREVAHTIKGWQVGKAKAFLEDVLQYKRAVPFTRFKGGVGRHAQAKLLSVPGSQCAWPQKASKMVLDLLTNAESNAEVKGMDTESLYITHAQVNRAPKQRRRTYRAHGRINRKYIYTICTWVEKREIEREGAPCMCDFVRKTVYV